jgi:catechol 2,3-dioxygenase-like lactoylglutathione lyase family enzyme
MGQLDHVHIRVRDRDAAAQWYAQHLGFEPVERFGFWADAVDRGPLQISADGGATSLALFESGPGHPMTPQLAGVAFSVDAPTFVAFARSLPNGICHPDGEPLTADYLVDFDLCFAYDLADPWGNRYELNCYDHEAVRSLLVDGDGIVPVRYWSDDLYESWSGNGVQSP